HRHRPHRGRLGRGRGLHRGQGDQSRHPGHRRQSEQAPSAYLSWKHQELRESPNRTRAEGLSTAAPFELPQRIMRRLLDDFVLVSDDEIDAATALMIEKTRA